jgi:phage regulator Rha-like protein
MPEKNKEPLGYDLASTEVISQKIYVIRGRRVILDRDLAELYGAPTKVLNQAVKRNRDRFPNDFVFRLNWEDTISSRSQIVTLKRGKNIKYPPFAFTEHGALMAANVLNSKRAVIMSVYLIRAFVRLREAFSANQILEKRLAEIEKTLLTHNSALRDLYSKIKPLLLPPPEKPKGRIGFHP